MSRRSRLADGNCADSMLGDFDSPGLQASEYSSHIARQPIAASPFIATIGLGNHTPLNLAEATRMKIRVRSHNPRGRGVLDRTMKI